MIKNTNDRLLQKLVELNMRLKRSPKLSDLKDFEDIPCADVYYEKFGSWNNALKLAGLSVNVRRDYTKEELLDLLKNRARILGRSPKIKEIEIDKNMPCREVFERNFGTFNKALAAAGLEVKYHYRKWTKEEIIKWLKYKCEELGRTPGIRDFDKDPKTPGKGTVRKLFGNWTNALREAKIPLRKYLSEDDLIKILQNLYLELNRTPTREELRKRKPTYVPFVEKFGSYTAACLRAGLVPNDGRNNNIWKSWQKHCEEMAKVIYKNIKTQFKDEKLGIPDIYIPNEKLFVDAKTCGYGDFKDQIRRYCSNGDKLEIWCIFKGLETRNDKVKYVYAGELAKIMKVLGREDLAVKCHQFIRNVFDENQKVLVVS